MGVKIPGLGCGALLYFPYPKAMVTALSDATREGRASRIWGEGAAPSSLLLPRKQKALPSYPQISPCSSVPALFFQRAKIKFACTSEKPGAFFSDAMRLKHYLLYTFLNIHPAAPFYSHCLEFVVI